MCFILCRAKLEIATVCSIHPSEDEGNSDNSPDCGLFDVRSGLRHQEQPRMVAKPQELRVPGAKCEEKSWEDETNSCGPLYLANCFVRMDNVPTNPGRKHCI